MAVFFFQSMQYLNGIYIGLVLCFEASLTQAHIRNAMVVRLRYDGFGHRLIRRLRKAFQQSSEALRAFCPQDGIEQGWITQGYVSWAYFLDNERFVIFQIDGVPGHKRKSEGRLYITLRLFNPADLLRLGSKEA